MKIGLQTFGSDGDVLPFIALAAGLSAKGHDVTLAITSVLHKDYTHYGKLLNFKIIAVQETFKNWDKDFFYQQTQEVIKVKDFLRGLAPIYKGSFLPALDEVYDTSKKLCSENDIVIGNYLMYPLKSAALKLSRPHAIVHFFPGIIPSRYTRPPETISLGNWLNPLWWKLLKNLLNKVLLEKVNAHRNQHGLPCITDAIDDLWLSNNLTLIPCSPSIYSRPLDWDNKIQQCGFLALAENTDGWCMPDSLKEFIESGEPPIYITFGVATSSSVRETLDLFIEAVNLTGCKAIIQAQWAVIEDTSETPNVYRLEGHVPHSKVFPLCALVVHHGGAGTTHSATLAGCPSVVIEHFGDQYFWGAELEKKGVALRPIARRSLTPQILAAAIKKTINSPDMKQKALALSQKMQNEESGVSRAVHFIESYFSLN